ncbi:hypothetical protein ACHAQH_006404 [Verticillium albo-atrum]
MDRVLLRNAFRAQAPLRLPTVSPIQQRCFTQTPARHDTRYITFDPDVSDNLAPILTEIQNKIILPYYLPPHQRERVFNEKHRNSLRMNPVDIEIDGLTHRFSHLSWKEIPSTRAVFHEALRHMETTHDWSNFVRLLSGLREAKRVINTPMFIKMIRQTGAKGRVFAVIDAARQTKRTGLRFDLPQKVQEVLLFVQLKALDAGWEKRELEQALRWSAMVLEMAADPSHKLDKRRPEWLSWPVERDPLALTAPLHLAAALAVGHHGGKDVDGKVAHWAKQVVGVWPAGKALLDVYPAEAFSGKGSMSGDRGDVRYLSAAPLYVAPAANALHGLKLAAQVVEPALAEKLNGIAAALEPELAKKIGELKDGLKEGSLPHRVYTNEFDAQGGVKLDVKASPVEETAPVEEVKADE